MNYLLPLLADQAPAPKDSYMQTIVMIAVAILFFYFILYRPEQKKRKALEARRSGIKKGDKVTAMGIVGTVDKVGDTTVVLKLIEGKMEVLKAAVTDVESVAEEK